MTELENHQMANYVEKTLKGNNHQQTVKYILGKKINGEICNARVRLTKPVPMINFNITKLMITRDTYFLI